MLIITLFIMEKGDFMAWRMYALYRVPSSYSCFHPIFKIAKYPIYFVITIPPCGHVDDYIKTTRFIEYMLTCVVCKIV